MEKIQIEKFLSGNSEKGMAYKYFLPHKINFQWQWSDASLNTLLEKASIKLGELNSFAKLVPNIDLFIHLHVTKEAVVSSRIEGTQTNMDEALLPIEEISPEKRNDWVEVNNYTQALNNAIKELKELPLSSRLLKKTHNILLQGVRGEHKMPGEFRRSQNWIGGNSLADAAFIPPAHNYVDELMGDLENFLHNKDIDVPALIRVAIAHYQFETIHPFLDGNGRIGRLLIPLYLVSEKILEKPLLYLSMFFEKNKGLYYDNLTRVREKNDLLHWLKYFLVGIAQTSELAVQTLSQILQIKERREALIKSSWGRRSASGLILLEYLFQEPVIRVKAVEQVCGLSTKAANDLVSSFIDSGILVEVSGQTRYRVFVFQEYLEMFR
ncbi:Fic family protein [Mucilaginibacter roseus]|uniref:Fic family protein n=1 Tax=Mucilaginibacter roseus TaxID=1528868 RepID=A0ABS8U4E0_9SPHI|nr:Fic family protein [Mucilaginibacter roseus]MCD8741966.1 Fic family protein [Mucilaginibacter roseus]